MPATDKVDYLIRQDECTMRMRVFVPSDEKAAEDSPENEEVRHLPWPTWTYHLSFEQ